MLSTLHSLVISLILALSSGAVFAEVVKIAPANLTLNANLERTESWPKGPVVLLTHGTLAHRGMEIISGLQTLLKERDISSLAINLSLGLDDRDAAMYDCPTPHRHKHSDAMAEIGAWLAWLKTQGAQRIALFGHSRGGNQSAWFAASNNDPAITQVFLAAPQTWSAEQDAKDYQKRYDQPLSTPLQQAQALVQAGNGQTLMGPMGFIYCADTRATADAVVDYYAPRPQMDTPNLIPSITTPVVVFIGTEDKVVSDLIDKMQPLTDGDRVQLEVLDGANHFFRDLYSEEIADIMEERLAVE